MLALPLLRARNAVGIRPTGLMQCHTDVCGDPPRLHASKTVLPSKPMSGTTMQPFFPGLLSSRSEVVLLLLGRLPRALLNDLDSFVIRSRKHRSRRLHRGIS
jgi:hypothetical protein